VHDVRGQVVITLRIFLTIAAAILTARALIIALS
jgi:hypothetical protein